MHVVYYVLSACKTFKLTLLLFNVLYFRHEFKNSHGEWITSEKPNLDTFVTEQMHDSLDITYSEIENIQRVRNDMKSALNALLKVCAFIFNWNIVVRLNSFIYILLLLR